MKLRVPVFGSLFHKTALSRFSRTLAMLVSAGVPILEALRHRLGHREQQDHLEGSGRRAGERSGR